MQEPLKEGVIAAGVIDLAVPREHPPLVGVDEGGDENGEDLREDEETTAEKAEYGDGTEEHRPAAALALVPLDLGIAPCDAVAELLVKFLVREVGGAVLVGVDVFVVIVFSRRLVAAEGGGDRGEKNEPEENEEEPEEGEGIGVGRTHVAEEVKGEEGEKELRRRDGQEHKELHKYISETNILFAEPFWFIPAVNVECTAE